MRQMNQKCAPSICKSPGGDVVVTLHSNDVQCTYNTCTTEHDIYQVVESRRNQRCVGELAIITYGKSRTVLHTTPSNCKSPGSDVVVILHSYDVGELLNTRYMSSES